MLTAADTRTQEPASFRDPAGAVYRLPDRILRSVQPDFNNELEAFLATAAAKLAIENGSLIGSAKISAALYPDLRAEHLWEHERVWFPSFPYEWSPAMLEAAGRLTLDLAEAVLDEGFGIKDATPYNVLFRGPRPVFIDVLSFERRDPLDATWLPYAQFVRTFLLPLLASKCLGLPLDSSLLSRRDGLEPETLYQWASLGQRIRPPFLGLVTIPKLLSRKGSANPSYHGNRMSSPEQARFVLSGLLRSCRRQLSAVAPVKPRESTWSGYLDHKSLYSPAQLAQKEKFVNEALDLAGPRRVLDVGANEGLFSFAAARRGAEVVAIDSDPVVTGVMWRTASAEQLNVLPLVVDLTRPAPAVGWRNQECPSFLDRARGSFDLVLMLAVIHHILVTERIPLEEVLSLVEEMTREFVLIEFVAPEDPMFQRIVRGRERLYSHFTPAWFEAAAASRFELIRSTRIDGLNRWLYLFRRRRVIN